MMHTLWSRTVLSHQSKRLLAIAIPMIICNITTPLIGLVDTAVVGHMQHEFYLAGVSLGAIVLTQVIWICGFFRMISTGLSAEAYGAKDDSQALLILLRMGILALLSGMLIVVLNKPLLSFGLLLSEANSNIASQASAYFNVRIWAAPCALLNMVLIGWLLGQQQHRFIMWTQITANLLNAGLDMLFVYGFDWGVMGVASASVIAEYTVAIMSVTFICKRSPIAIASSGKAHLSKVRLWLQLLWDKTEFKRLLALNSDMLLRNLMLQVCLAFITYKGTAMGHSIAATNAILMQFFMLTALSLDGLAYATEALVGERKGAGSRRILNTVVGNALLWSSVAAVVHAAVFYLFGENIINLLTNIESLRISAVGYLWIVAILPITAHWCFLLDGVYIGLANARVMRNSMCLSMLVFFGSWWLLADLGNWGLWACFLIFLAFRGITLGGHYYRQFYLKSLT